MTADLPPSATFELEEIRHGIKLAPLADFLAHLKEGVHLIRLAEILERYRTPQSYHRYDYRIVDSSDLPPSPGGDDEEQAFRRKRERGSPVFIAARGVRLAARGTVELSEGLDIGGEKGKEDDGGDETIGRIGKEGEESASNAGKEGEESALGGKMGSRDVDGMEGEDGMVVGENKNVDDPSLGLESVKMRAVAEGKNQTDHGRRSGEAEATKLAGATEEGRRHSSRSATEEPEQDGSNRVAQPTTEPAMPAPSATTTSTSTDVLPALDQPVAKDDHNPTIPVTLAEAEQMPDDLSSPLTPLPPEELTELSMPVSPLALTPIKHHDHSTPDPMAAIANVVANGQGDLHSISRQTQQPPAPGGTARCVRELRLDIRSLDPAALFELEEWRRAVLGLEELDMLAPQSKWYKQIEVPKKRGRGRPRKSGSVKQAADGEQPNAEAAPPSPPHSLPPSPDEPASDLPDKDTDSDFEPSAMRGRPPGSGRSKGRGRGARVMSDRLSRGSNALHSATEPDTTAVASPRGRGRPRGRPRGSGRGGRSLLDRQSDNNIAETTSLDMPPESTERSIDLTLESTSSSNISSPRAHEDLGDEHAEGELPASTHEAPLLVTTELSAVRDHGAREQDLNVSFSDAADNEQKTSTPHTDLPTTPALNEPPPDASMESRQPSSPVEEMAPEIDLIPAEPGSPPSASATQSHDERDKQAYFKRVTRDDQSHVAPFEISASTPPSSRHDSLYVAESSPSRHDLARVMPPRKRTRSIERSGEIESSPTLIPPPIKRAAFHNDDKVASERQHRLYLDCVEIPSSTPTPRPTNPARSIISTNPTSTSIKPPPPLPIWTLQKDEIVELSAADQSDDDEWIDFKM